MDFFDLSSKLLSSTFHSSPIHIPYDGNLELIAGNYNGIEMPVIFQQNSGKNLLDILDTGYANLLLISEKLKSVLKENKLTGWKTYPIKLYDKKGLEIIGYHGFSVTGRCGPIQYGKSEIIEKRLISTGPVVKFYKGLSFGLESWDGSDFFSPKDTIRIITNEKVFQLMREQKISNLVMEPLDEIKTRVAGVLRKV